jgi:predicted DNA-binding transcriptional regulator AlpA
MSVAEIPPNAVLLTEDQCAQLMQVTTRTLRRMVSAGRFPKPIKLGANTESQQCRRRWVRAEVDAWLQKLMEQRA